MSPDSSSSAFDLTALRRVESGEGLGALVAGMPAMAEQPADINLQDLDDQTTRYVLAVRPAFDGLRRAAMQLSGLLLLAATGIARGWDHPMLDLAREAHERAGDALRGITTPPRAAHHHLHLVSAERALGEAFDCTRPALSRADDAAEAIRRHTQSAIDHLRWAAGALPGLEIVALSQGCCAVHAPEAGGLGNTKKKAGLYCGL